LEGPAAPARADTRAPWSGIGPQCPGQILVVLKEQDGVLDLKRVSEIRIGCSLL
jgi:hypothetical protein